MAEEGGGPPGRRGRLVRGESSASDDAGQHQGHPRRRRLVRGSSSSSNSHSASSGSGSGGESPDTPRGVALRTSQRARQRSARLRSLATAPRAERLRASSQGAGGEADSAGEPSESSDSGPPPPPPMDEFLVDTEEEALTHRTPTRKRRRRSGPASTGRVSPLPLESPSSAGRRRMLRRCPSSSDSEGDVHEAATPTRQSGRERKTNRSRAALMQFKQVRSKGGQKQVRDSLLQDDQAGCAAQVSSEEEEMFVDDGIVTSSSGVRCRCGAVDDKHYAGLWVRCTRELCSQWQHAACYGYQVEADIPPDFACIECWPRDVANAVGSGSKLFALIRDRREDEAIALIDQGGEVDWINTEGTQTPLLAAASLGQLRVVRHLIAHKANVAWSDLDNCTALSLAVAGGHSLCVRAVLDLSPSTAFRMITLDAGLSIYHLAAGAGNVDVFQAVLDADQGYSAEHLWRVTGEGMNVLAVSANAGHVGMLRYLVKHHQGDLLWEDQTGAGLAHFAALSGSCEMLAWLMEQLPLAHLERTDKEGCTPLMCAAQAGATDCIRELLRLGVPVLCRDKHGSTPLHMSALSGHTECISLLIASGHPVDCLDNVGWPPLLYANFQADEEAVLALMRPKPHQLAVLGHLLTKFYLNEDDRLKNLDAVVTLITSLATHDVYYSFLNDFIRDNPALLNQGFAFLFQQKGLLDFDNKLRWFHDKLANPGVYARPLQMFAERGHLFSGLVQCMQRWTCDELQTGSLSIQFVGEPGICLGPKREFLSLLIPELVDSEWDLLTQCSAGSPLLWFPARYATGQGFGASPPSSPCRLLHLRYLGMFVGHVLVERSNLNLNLAGPLWKQVLGLPLDLPDDLQEVDAEVYDSLQWVLDHSVEGLDLEFAYDVSCTVPASSDGGATASMASIPIGPAHLQNEPVTDDNKKEYVAAVAQLKLVDMAKKEVEAFRDGLFGVVPQEHISVFSPKELSLLLCGVRDISVEDWRAATTYTFPYAADKPQIVWFWGVVAGLNKEEKAMLLQFTTGCSGLPASGFAGLNSLLTTSGLTIASAADTTRLPTASTCFNLLKLPRYQSEPELRKKLLIAIRYGSQGFTFS